MGTGMGGTSGTCGFTRGECYYRPATAITTATMYVSDMGRKGVMGSMYVVAYSNQIRPMDCLLTTYVCLPALPSLYLADVRHRSTLPSSTLVARAPRRSSMTTGSAGSAKLYVDPAHIAEAEKDNFAKCLSALSAFSHGRTHLRPVFFGWGLLG